MSDCCASQLRCLKVDMELFQEEGFDTDYEYDEYSDDKPYVDLYQDQCNYGAQLELEDLAARGIPFYGNHGCGDEYPEARFAAADGMIAWPPCLNDSLAVTVNDHGEINTEDMDLVMRYLTLLRRAQELLGENSEDSSSDGSN